MVTYAQNLTSKAQSWVVIVRIEGVGMYLSNSDLSDADDDGQIRFCSAIPDYASTMNANLWRDYLTDFPKILSEKVDKQGGFPVLGALEFSILDHGNYLTDLLRLENERATVAAENITASATELMVGSAGDFPTGSIFWIGAECIRSTLTSGSDLQQLDRGYAGTEAQAHETGDFVHSHIQFLRGRRVSVKVAPIDGSSSDETEVGTWVIDSLKWDQTLNIWTFGAKTELKYLHRAAPADPTPEHRVLRVDAIDDDRLLSMELDGIDTDWGFWGTNAIFRRQFFVKVGDEIIACRPVTTGASATTSNNSAIVFPTERGVAGTPRDLPEKGDKAVRVMVAGDEGSFRWSSSGATSRTAGGGVWDYTSNWLDIIAIIAMSSADSENDNIATNFNATYGNFASLPAGYGIGLPHTKWDWASWQELRNASAGQDFPYFWFGDERMSFGELIETNFLKPLGAFLTVSSGLVKIVVPDMPGSDASSFSIGPDNILTEEVGPKQMLPKLFVSYGIGGAVNSLIYKLGPQKFPLQVNANGPWSERRFYATDEAPVVLEIPGADPNDAAFLADALMRKLFRQHRPQYEIRVDVDYSAESLSPGNVVDVTMNEGPNLEDGTRDWSTISAEVLENTRSIDMGGGAFCSLRLDGYGAALRSGKVSPAGYIESVSVNDATITANRFTFSDAPGDLPTTDAAAFTVGDVVRLENRDGSDAGGGTETVDGITSNTLELSGNFSGNLAADLVIVYAAYSESTSTQQASWVYLSNQNTGVVTGSVPEWVFAS